MSFAHPIFISATEQMKTYRPAEHEETTSVAPLLQFFELVHMGDTIQSMVQVFFDKEMAQHIDRTDFLNAVMREKKRFENALDDSVAAGLNAGTEVLMNQVGDCQGLAHSRRFDFDCTRSSISSGLAQRGGNITLRRARIWISDLQKDALSRSSASKRIVNFSRAARVRRYWKCSTRRLGCVFTRESLHSQSMIPRSFRDRIIQKHIKRQIISLEGGFQVIADLNAYHAFIASLKVPTITSDFANLKMLGHVYIVSDAKDLAQIVRDVQRYGGVFRPEVTVYDSFQCCS